MSAFVVNKSHINAMLHAGFAVGHRRLTWDHHGKRYVLTHETANAVGQMLLDQCVRSVSARYPNDAVTNLPGRADAEWLLSFRYRLTDKRPTPIEAIMLIRCYEYQSCEDEGWRDSQARAFCDSLCHATISQLPGYDAAPWEWEDSEYYQAEPAAAPVPAESFAAGRMVVTPGVADLAAKDPAFAEFMETCLKRHLRKDWGELDEEDRRTNEDALKHGDRLFSAYKDPRWTEHGVASLWIITEHDRSVTTILFPDEY